MSLFYIEKGIKERFFKAGTEALWVFAGQVGIVAGSLFGIKILTYLLSQSEFGRFSLANTIILLIGLSLFNPLGQGLMRFWSIAQERRELETFLRVSRQYVIVLLCLVFFIALTGSCILVMSPWNDWIFLFCASIITGGIAGWANVRIYVLMAARKRKVVAIINTATAFIKPLLGGVVAWFFFVKADWVIAGYLAAGVVSSIVTEKIYKATVCEKKISSETRDQQLGTQPGSFGREILSFSLPFFLWGIFGWIHQFCDRWSVMAFHGADVVGAYAVISQLAVYPLIFGANFLNVFFTPIAYDRAGALQPAKSLQSANMIVYLMTGIYALGAFILIFIFTFYHNWIVVLVSNERYTEFSYLLPWLSLSWSFYYLGQMLSGFGFLANKSRLYIAPAVVSGICATIATFYLSSQFGPPGVVAGIGVAGGIYAFWCMAIGIHLLKKGTDSLSG